jgi:hypothetical protein
LELELELEDQRLYAIGQSPRFSPRFGVSRSRKDLRRKERPTKFVGLDYANQKRGERQKSKRRGKAEEKQRKSREKAEKNQRKRREIRETICVCVCVCLPACVLNRRVFPKSRLSTRYPKKSDDPKKSERPEKTRENQRNQTNQRNQRDQRGQRNQRVDLCVRACVRACSLHRPSERPPKVLRTNFQELTNDWVGRSRKELWGDGAWRWCDAFSFSRFHFHSLSA